MTMRYTTHDEKYLIAEHGNGWAYEITEVSSGDSLWFQDSDACNIQTETQNFENTEVIKSYFENLFN